MSKPLSVMIEGPEFSYSDARTAEDSAHATEVARKIAQYAMTQLATLTKRPKVEVAAPDAPNA